MSLPGRVGGVLVDAPITGGYRRGGPFSEATTDEDTQT